MMIRFQYLQNNQTKLFDWNQGWVFCYNANED